MLPAGPALGRSRQEGAEGGAPSPTAAAPSPALPCPLPCSWLPLNQTEGLCAMTNSADLPETFLLVRGSAGWRGWLAEGELERLAACTWQLNGREGSHHVGVGGPPRPRRLAGLPAAAAAPPTTPNPNPNHPNNPLLSSHTPLVRLQGNFEEAQGYEEECPAEEDPLPTLVLP